MSKLDPGPIDALGPVTRAFNVLRVLAEASEPLSVTNIAAITGLPTSTVHRLLQLMREQDIVDFDPTSRRYRPGLEIYRLGALVTARHQLADLARPYLTAINNVIDENCQLGVLLRRERAMMFTEQIQTSQALRFSTPMFVPQPLIWGCSGRVICAHLDPDDLSTVLETSEPSPVASRPVPAAKDFLTDLDQIRDQGWDTTRGEKVPDSIGFAAPVFDARGITASLSITIPITRYHNDKQDQFVTTLTTAASALSTALGHLPDVASKSA